MLKYLIYRVSGLQDRFALLKKKHPVANPLFACSSGSIPRLSLVWHSLKSFVDAEHSFCSISANLSNIVKYFDELSNTTDVLWMLQGK